jgi:hypothetical protein
LSPKFRIGLMQVHVDEATLDKNSQAQNEFVKMCVDLGAIFVPGDEKVDSLITIIPQRPYSETATDQIKKIRSEKTIGAMAFAWAGIAEHDQFIDTFKINAALSIDKKFLSFLIEKRNAGHRYKNVALEDIGLPYGKYPIFNNFRADYILAMPTPFSFAHEKDKWHFLEAALKLVKHIPAGDIIAHKPHNGFDRDQFSSPKFRKYLTFFKILAPILQFLKSSMASHPQSVISKFFGRAYTLVLYEKLLSRTIPMHKMTDFHQFSLEAFLPHVKKGVIGGLSNTIWGSLFFKLPFYNCVDITTQQRNAKDRLMPKKNFTPLLDVNLMYFGVPFCEGKMNFDIKNFGVIDDSTRNGDLIALLTKIIEKTAEASPEYPLDPRQ